MNGTCGEFCVVRKMFNGTFYLSESLPRGAHVSYFLFLPHAVVRYMYLYVSYNARTMCVGHDDPHIYFICVCCCVSFDISITSISCKITLLNESLTRNSRIYHIPQFLFVYQSSMNFFPVLLRTVRRMKLYVERKMTHASFNTSNKN